MPSPHIFIIGAGPIGLLLAHSLQRHSIPYTIYDRSPTPLLSSRDHKRSRGWGLTLHWALDDFISLLPRDLVERLPETYVNPEAVARGEKGRFLFYDLASSKARWEVPAARRVRVGRERLVGLLREGLEVQWGKKVTGIRKGREGEMVVNFEDGEEARGTYVVGVDGTYSAVRRVVCRESHEVYRLPVRFVGMHVALSEEEVRPVLDLDPYFLQGGDPKTDAFLWWSVLSTPSMNVGQIGLDGKYECQVMVAWPYREGFLGRTEPVDVPETSKERLALVREITKDWSQPFRSLVQAVPDDIDLQEVKLEDWVPPAEGWNNFDGRVTLMGDAAHAMVMFRGEGANHGIKDVKNWLDNHLDLLKRRDWSSEEAREATIKYEAEVRTRTRHAVLASRRAAEDAVTYQSIDDRSPLVNRRAVVAE
ncbi:hypothetical protein KVT40_003274 [Elsinoe batatas]|uniref:FAD-binding domain-containing protein n=1 Tax=Elsinoe batatas TaxID=2601811 RepID=A0A8K0L6J1_9PEZI|nr:hypothetical protein KVT40_003274 [Elsinoe batatas]